MFIKKAPNSHGWVDPKVVEQLWLDQFNYFYREYDEFVFPVTIHPDVAGHPHVLFMLERFVKFLSLAHYRTNLFQNHRIHQYERRCRVDDHGANM